MRKYLVKNCPENPSETTIFYGWCNKEQKRCQDVDNCPIKQIVYKCIGQARIPEVNELKKEILKLLEINEVYTKPTYIIDPEEAMFREIMEDVNIERSAQSAFNFLMDEVEIL